MAHPFCIDDYLNVHLPCITKYSMSKFKTAIQLTEGAILKTVKGISTDWTFLGDSDKNSKTGRRYVFARCKCGKEKRICLNNVRNGNSICCGQFPCRGGEKEKDPEVGYRALVYVYKKHARERGLSFQLTYDHCKDLFGQSCFYCGQKPKQVYQLKHRGTDQIRSGHPITYNGIDRVDSKKGYTSDNVVTCCKICNRAKSNMTLQEFQQWISQLIKNFKKWRTH
jgi:5-methylcytosine-specific restriction endonuclease McrA